MPRADLFLWILLRPATIAFGAVGAIACYRLARPRESVRCGDLLVEGWRLYALVVAALGFLVGAEVGLWLVVLAYRAPLVFTGLPVAVGWTLVALAPVPLAAALCGAKPLAGRPLALAAAGLGFGAVLVVGGRWARDAAWSNTVRRAASDSDARSELVMLKSYRYVPSGRAVAALDAALPDDEDILALVAAAREGQGPVFDADLDRYFLARLQKILDGADRSAPPERESAVVPLFWWLAEKSAVSDPARLRQAARSTIDAYARASSGGPLSRDARQGVDPQTALVTALTTASPATAAAVLAAFDAGDFDAPLSADTILALAPMAREPAPVGPTAVALLLEDGSVSALRPILPRLAGRAGAAWDVLRARCPHRTQGLSKLTSDPDPSVAEGARAALGYVRQYCVDWYRP